MILIKQVFSLGFFIYPVSLCLFALPVQAAMAQKYNLAVRIEPQQKTQTVAIPLPLSQDTVYQKNLGYKVKGNYNSAKVFTDSKYQTQALVIDFSGQKEPLAEVQFSVENTDRTLGSPVTKEKTPTVFLQATEHIQTDGIVLETALQITKGLTDPEKKARAIYDWVVDKTFRDSTIKGCGFGDVKGILQSGNFGGKCADLNSLFVGLARAVGVPAREVFGLRAGKSKIATSLGKEGELTGAQHCRAEFWTQNRGWVPVDPADVRKVILEEKLLLGSAREKEIREKLFGSWEMNWVAFNYARDFVIPGTTKKINYFMYPVAIDQSENDSLSPNTFRYSISSNWN